MIKKKTALLLLGLTILNTNVLASGTDKSANQAEASNTTQFQKVVDEYKAYLADINAKTREEIIAYRKEIARLNRLKREEYQKLSQDGQAFLAKEQEFKKRLPLKQRKHINITNPGEKSENKDKAE